MYMNQLYNRTAIEGEGGMLRSDVFVADVKHKFSAKTALRTEAGSIRSKDGDRDWLLLAECSLAPAWMFTLSDLYNSGRTHIHYYQALVTFTPGAHRLQIGYGRT